MHIKTAFLTFYMYSYKFTLLFLDVHHKMMHIKWSFSHFYMHEVKKNSPLPITNPYRLAAICERLLTKG